MKNSTRRLISMLLVLCMCLAMLPTLRVSVEAAGYYTEAWHIHVLPHP